MTRNEIASQSTVVPQRHARRGVASQLPHAFTRVLYYDVRHRAKHTCPGAHFRDRRGRFAPPFRESPVTRSIFSGMKGDRYSDPDQNYGRLLRNRLLTTMMTTFVCFVLCNGFLATVARAAATLVVDSMPSGHTATAFSIAHVLAHQYPRQKPRFYALALLAGWSRVETSNHWPSDVATGALIGLWQRKAPCAARAIVRL